MIRALVREELAKATAEVNRAAPADLISERELAAQLTGVSRETIRQWRRRGEGPPFVRVGRAIPYSSADVRAWLTSRTRGHVR